jgi:imidazolonepropionase-like amidohydrolase
MRRIYVIIFLILFSPALFSQNSTDTLVCFTHVSVVNVISGKVDSNQTVVITNGRISATGPFKKIKIPANASVIDASGKYLMPGLTDAHIHFFQSAGLYTRPDGVNLGAVYPYEKDQQWLKDNLDDLMARYLACGITTVIDVGGPMSNYATRDKVNANVNAPNAYVTGPLISTYTPPNLDKKDPPIVTCPTPEDARALVRKQVPYKPDFIKIWYIVGRGLRADSTLPVVKAAIEESHANGLKVCVHATEYETAKLAVQAGADILVHSVDDQVLDNDMLQLLKTKKTVYIPTLLVGQNAFRVYTQQFNFSAHDFKYANPFMLGTLSDVQHLSALMPFNYKQIRSRLQVPSKRDSTMLVNVKLAQDAGVLVVAGTDAGNPGTHHAASFYDEMLAMQKAGLTNWEILRSATINAARGFGHEKDYGSIVKGKIADLILLDKNPVLDINIPENLHTIIHKGALIDPRKLITVTPEALVQQQLNAYNARDIEAFLAPYSDTAMIYDMKGNIVMNGKANMRQSYTHMFNNIPELHCQIKNRIVQGTTIIDQERITGFNNTPLEAVGIYTIEGDKITKVVFIQ